MSEPITPPEAAAPSPVPAGRFAGAVEAIKELLPPLALSAALMVMTQVAIPQANHDPVNIIIGGFLGYLTGRAANRKPADPHA